MKNNLVFVEPKFSGYIQKEYDRECKDLIFPIRQENSNLRWSAKKSPTLYRNIIAWYLKAAGLTGREVGEFLSISSSRASQLAARTRAQIFRTFFDMTGGELAGEILEVHLLRGTRIEMIAAECALSKFCSEQNIHAVSAALRIGREQYLASYEKISGIKCSCRLCALFDHENLGPYWTDRT